MAAPIVAAGVVAIAKYIMKNGMKLAIKKYGKKAAEEGGKVAAKARPTKYKKTRIKPEIPSGSNPAPQQAKPTRMPKQKNMQGPKNPKGMGFSGGGKVTHKDYRKKGMFK